MSGAADDSPVYLSVELTREQACALHRLCEKTGHGEALATLYAHVSRAQRNEQAYIMTGAATRLQEALEAQGIRGWPWVETGHV